MFNTSVLSNIQDYHAFELRDNNIFLTSLFESILQYSDDEIILVDKDFNVLLTNQKLLKKYDNIEQLLQIPVEYDIISQLIFKRTIVSKRGKIPVKIMISGVSTGSSLPEEYLIIIKDLSEKEKIQNKLRKLTSFIKHDLKPVMIAQVRAAEYMIKTKNTKELLPELLNSVKFAYNSVDNISTEFHYKKGGIIPVKKKYPIGRFLSFLNSYDYHVAKNQFLKVSINGEFDIDLDEKLIQRAIINILSKVSDRTAENETLYLSVGINKNYAEFSVSGEFILPDKRVLSDISFKEHEYDRIDADSGIFFASEIIKAHGGKISMFSDGNTSTFKILLPF